MQIKPPAGAAIYDRLAPIYDLTGQSRFSLKMVAYMLEVCALNRLKPRRILDLACGTGAAAVALARRRFEVTGVDGSAGMLEVAAARAARWKATVDWRQQDLAALDLPGGYDLAMCLYDALNHLTDPADLRKAFYGVRRTLAPGGLFFFDMNTTHAYARVWGNAQDAYLGPRHARFWRARHDAETGLATLEATYFVPEADGRYARVAITHTARGYDPDQVRALLREAGFEPLFAYECLSFEPAGPATYRVAYMARAA